MILRKISDIVEKVETFLIVVLVILMIVFSFLQIVFRNLLSISIFWFDDFSRHAVLWVGFLGASVVTAHAKHINIDILSRVFKGKAKRALNVTKYLISSAICVILFMSSIKFIGFEMEGREVSPNLRVPVWYLQAFFPVIFGMMVFRFVLLSIEELFDRTQRKSEDIHVI